jgi:hypothetical protein
MGDRPHAPHVELLIGRLPEPIHKLLAAAAERRHMSAGDLAARLIGGTVTRGSVDKTLSRWASYERSRQLNMHLKDRRRGNGRSDHAAQV